MSTSTIMVIILAVLTALVVGTFLWVYIRDKTIDEIRVDVSPVSEGRTCI